MSTNLDNGDVDVITNVSEGSQGSAEPYVLIPSPTRPKTLLDRIAQPFRKAPVREKPVVKSKPKFFVCVLTFAL